MHKIILGYLFFIFILTNNYLFAQSPIDEISKDSFSVKGIYLYTPVSMLIKKLGRPNKIIKSKKANYDESIYKYYYGKNIFEINTHKKVIGFRLDSFPLLVGKNSYIKIGDNGKVVKDIFPQSYTNRDTRIFSKKIKMEIIEVFIKNEDIYIYTYTKWPNHWYLYV